MCVCVRLGWFGGCGCQFESKYVCVCAGGPHESNTRPFAPNQHNGISNNFERLTTFLGVSLFSGGSLVLLIKISMRSESVLFGFSVCENEERL